MLFTSITEFSSGICPFSFVPKVSTSPLLILGLTPRKSPDSWMSHLTLNRILFCEDHCWTVGNSD